ncbi:MAG: CPBP family glutamic-type intramembrane protease [Acidimicrobiales bacterium]
MRLVAQFSATGIGEEVLYRGVIWSILVRLDLRLAAVVAVDVGVFVVWHVPAVLAGDSTWGGLWAVGLFGLLFAAARAASRRVELPILLHIAADIPGS